MVLNAFEWAVIGAAAALAIGAIGYFLKGFFKKPEKHDDAINDIKQSYATKQEVKEQGKEIRDIRENFVRREELREMQKEWKSDTQELRKDIQKVADNCLSKSDFLATQSKTDEQLKQMLGILIEMKGGNNNAGK